MDTIKNQTLIPAYGKDYNSKAAVTKDFLVGRDFRAEPSGQYCNIQDFPKGSKAKLRYSKLTKVTFVKVP